MAVECDLVELVEAQGVAAEKGERGLAGCAEGADEVCGEGGGGAAHGGEVFGPVLSRKKGDRVAGEEPEVEIARSVDGGSGVVAGGLGQQLAPTEQIDDGAPHRLPLCGKIGRGCGEVDGFERGRGWCGLDLTADVEVLRLGRFGRGGFRLIVGETDVGEGSAFFGVEDVGKLIDGGGDDGGGVGALVGDFFGGAFDLIEGGLDAGVGKFSQINGRFFIRL